MERSRLVRAILRREIHARPDVNNMVDFNTKLFIISLTFFRDFLSLEAENTLFFNDVERNLYFFFFSYLYLFFGQISKNSGLFRTHCSSLSLQWLQEPFPNEIHGIWATDSFFYLQVGIFTFGRPPNEQRKQIAVIVWGSRPAIRSLIAHF